MTVTLAKWTIDDYHQMIEAGILANRSVELLNAYQTQNDFMISLELKR